jgi:uncharacterized membrane protein
MSNEAIEPSQTEPEGSPAVGSLDGISGEDAEPTLAIALSEQRYFSGPLPPPEVLQGYEGVCPGSAREIIGVFLKQSDHRMAQERATSNRAYMGVIAAFLLCATTVVGACVLILRGHEGAGATLGVAGLSSVVATFIYGTRSVAENGKEQPPKPNAEGG